MCVSVCVCVSETGVGSNIFVLWLVGGGLGDWGLAFGLGRWMGVGGGKGTGSCAGCNDLRSARAELSQGVLERLQQAIAQKQSVGLGARPSVAMGLFSKHRVR